GVMEDLDILEELGAYVAESSLCGLGKSAANPLLSTLRFFRDEYVEHIEHRRCPAGICKELTTFSIDLSKCTACGLCAKVCPVDAVIVEDGSYRIDTDKCIRCGECRNVCRFEAVVW
ncbi:MAG: 4Fe-4S binding protein, partial [Spirochaetota bacterium]|nr:4Fe-4S binding protein [Spirochaetota bacterium]